MVDYTNHLRDLRRYAFKRNGRGSKRSDAVIYTLVGVPMRLLFGDVRVRKSYDGVVHDVTVSNNSGDVRGQCIVRVIVVKGDHLVQFKVFHRYDRVPVMTPGTCYRNQS